MALPSVFNNQTTQECLTRLENLTPSTTPKWGKMDVAQMLAHVNVAYDSAYGKIAPIKNPIKKFILKFLVKPIVVSEKVYKKNSPTGPEFIITGTRDFEKEKTILINYIKDTEQKGIAYFEGKENLAFGKMTSQEWSNQFYKHFDHHFTQFGV